MGHDDLASHMGRKALAPFETLMSRVMQGVVRRDVEGTKAYLERIATL